MFVCCYLTQAIPPPPCPLILLLSLGLVIGAPTCRVVCHLLKPDGASALSCTSRDRSVTLHSQERRVVVRSAEWKSRVNETSFSSCHPCRQFCCRCLPSPHQVSYLLSLSMMMNCGGFSSLILVFVLPSIPSCCLLRVVTTGAICHWDNSAVWQWSSSVSRWCWCWRIDNSLCGWSPSLYWQGSNFVVNSSLFWFSWRCVTEPTSAFRQQCKGNNCGFNIYVAFFFNAVVSLLNRCLQSSLLLPLLLQHTDQTSTDIFQSSAARQHFSDWSRVAVVRYQSCWIRGWRAHTTDRKSID